MAVDKKSFVLYSDLIHTIRKMPPQKAGELFLHILEYVNDENPETDDLIINLTFEPIKQSLKRDLVRYENKKKQWSEAGKASAEAKKEKRSSNSTDVNERSKRSTVSTVSVNDSVSVNVNDNVLSKDNIKTKTKVLEFIELSNSEIESIKMKYGDEAYNFCIETLNNYKGSSGKKYKSDYHTICGWVMTKFNEFKKQNQNGTKHESPTEYAERMYKTTLGYSPSEVRTED